MKKLIGVFLMLAALVANAQSSEEKELIERTFLLSATVIGTKDSAVLEDLFASKLTYGHSGGKVENRQEAIYGITQNRSVYSDTSLGRIMVVVEDDAAVVRHSFSATETGKEGKISNLNFAMMLVWVKQDGKWKLMGRQAVKLK